jgi:hypothetical protein
MLRGYRLYIAALGLALASANHANAEGGKQQPQTEQSATKSLSDIAAANRQEAERAKRADQDEAPCGEGKYGSSADLCAQWKAADAASDSAWWAWAAGVSSIISTMAVLLAIGLTYQANSIARDTARRQLRAYMSVTSCELEMIEDGYILTATLNNCGQTPAYKTRISGESFADSYPLEEERPFLPLEDGYSATIGPGHPVSCTYRLFVKAKNEAFRMAQAGQLGFYIQGICEYYDAFGTRRETKFRYVFGGRIANTGGLVMHAAETGNEAD